MENYILNRYDKDENGNLIIKIHTKKIEDLYEDYDQKSSFIKKDLKEKLEEYLGYNLPFKEEGEVYLSDLDVLDSLKESNRVVVDKSKDLRKGITKIYLNGGKNKKIRPGDIVGAICEIDGVTVDDIGVIQVQDHQSYVDILNDKGKLVLKNLKTIKGKTLRIQKAKNGFGH